MEPYDWESDDFYIYEDGTTEDYAAAYETFAEFPVRHYSLDELLNFFSAFIAIGEFSLAEFIADEAFNRLNLSKDDDYEGFDN